jgi:hypothetical protein
MKRLINAVRIAWLYARRAMAQAEIRDMAKQGVIGGQMLDEYRRQVSDYERQIARLSPQSPISEGDRPMHKQVVVALALVGSAALLVVLA